MEEFLKSLGINEEGITEEDGCYVIDFMSDDEWSKAYSRLDNSDEIFEDEDSSNVSMDASTIQFVNDDYTVTLLADFNEDTYRLSCREN